MSSIDFENILKNGLPKEVRAKLKYYVYVYIDPRDDKPFYVGKGVGERVLDHIEVSGDSDKGRKLDELRATGIVPRLAVVRHGMTESEAFAVEAVLIEHIGLLNLVNKVAGKGTSEFGFMTLPQICSRYAADPVTDFIEPTILFRLSATFRYSMAGENASEQERLALFEATCGTWKLGDTRNQMKYAMSVYDNVIQEIYEIKCWNPGGTREYRTLLRDGDHSSLWEFDGHRCLDEKIRAAYLGKNVKHYFPRGFAGGFRYCFPGESVKEIAA